MAKFFQCIDCLFHDLSFSTICLYIVSDRKRWQRHADIHSYSIFVHLTFKKISDSTHDIYFLYSGHRYCYPWLSFYTCACILHNLYVNKSYFLAIKRGEKESLTFHMWGVRSSEKVMVLRLWYQVRYNYVEWDRCTDIKTVYYNNFIY